MVERAEKGPKDNGDFFIKSFFIVFPGQVPGGELERLKRYQRSTTTYFVGLSYFYSLVRYQKEN